MWTWFSIIVLRFFLGVDKTHILWGVGTLVALSLWYALVPGFGDGDVKLLSAAAFFLGWKTPVFLLFTFVLALAFGLVLVCKTRDKNTLIPLAVPALVAFAIVFFL